MLGWYGFKTNVGIMISSTNEPSESRIKPRWFYAYFALAIFNIITVSTCFYLNRQIVDLYYKTVARNKEWAVYREHLSTLSQLALEVDIPGNNVFTSMDPKGEALKYQEARSRFVQHLNSLESKILTMQNEALKGVIIPNFDGIKVSLRGMDMEAGKVFREYSHGNVNAAAKGMSIMDKHYAEIIKYFANISQGARQIRQTFFDEQLNIANQLKIIEWVIGGFVLLMVMGAGYYGNQLIRRTQENDEQKRLAEIELQTLFNAALDCIIVINQQGIVQSVNRTVTQILGYEEEDIIGKNISLIIPEPFKSNHNSYLWNYLQTGEAKLIGTSREVEAVHKDGHLVPIALGVNEMKLSHAKMFVGTLHDLSERKAAEGELKNYALELEEARKKAEETSRLKSEFLANMSHEIRTPMNGVIGMTNLLLDTKLDDVQKQYARIVSSSADNLLQLVNDILDFSKIEAGKLELEIISFDMQQLLEEVADVLSVKAQEKGVEILLRFAPDTPRFVRGDPGRIRQVLLNLAGNALKFTEVGHVLLSIETRKKSQGSVTYYAAIEDTGIGIPEDKIEYIFNKFSQADSSTTRKFGGTGLGLAICKELVHMMGGEIDASSQLGIGSTFWFTIELSMDSEREIREPIDFESDLTGIRGLIVDDNEVAQKISIEQMVSCGMVADAASSAKEALKMLHEAAIHGKPYQFAILDYMMPEMDGLELASIIKSDEVLASTAMLMISSAISLGNEENMIKSGFSGFLTKPLNSVDIVRAISIIWAAKQKHKVIPLVTRCSLHETGSLQREKTRKNIRLEGVQILLVEDNQVNQVVATNVLAKYGCHITPAGNGKEAVQLVKQRKFDLIFMDCQMPEMDGYEATVAIRALEQRSHGQRTPIIALTASAMKGDESKCINAGMDDYISKPVKQKMLEDVLVKWLKPDIETVENTDVLSKDCEKGVVVNEGVFHQLQILLEEQFDVLIQNYISDSKYYVGLLEVHKDDMETLERAIHPLKSSSQQIGAEIVAGIAERIEQAVMNKQHIDYEQLIKELQAASNDACEYLTQKIDKNNEKRRAG